MLPSNISSSKRSIALKGWRLIAMSVRERVRRELRAGLDDLDEGIREAASRYLRGELSLREYLDLRARLEAEKEKKVLENLRRFHSPKSGTRPR
ncbi:MAG: hypothetical protein DRN61_04405 [Thaumarchaeota archaeon]|nr:MAG: hypothetical protein DRN61_04405 [Nitrososphaerota archaeon]